jgi:hypothetical protein
MLIKYTMLCLLFALALNGVGNVTSKPKEIKKIASRFSSLGQTYIHSFLDLRNFALL